MVSTDDIVKCFFTKLDDNTYRCRCNVKSTQKKNTGYTNLKTHVIGQHKNFETELVAFNNQRELG